MTTILLIVIIGLIVYSIFKDRSASAYPEEPYYHPETAKHTLEELRAREILERDYEFQVPSFGMLNGKRIPIRDITRSMRQDSSFLSPHAMGKWVKKGEKAEWR